MGSPPYIIVWTSQHLSLSTPGGRSHCRSQWAIELKSVETERKNIEACLRPFILIAAAITARSVFRVSAHLVLPWPQEVTFHFNQGAEASGRPGPLPTKTACGAFPVSGS